MYFYVVILNTSPRKHFLVGAFGLLCALKLSISAKTFAFCDIRNKSIGKKCLRFSKSCLFLREKKVKEKINLILSEKNSHFDD